MIGSISTQFITKSNIQYNKEFDVTQFLIVVLCAQERTHKISDALLFMAGIFQYLYSAENIRKLADFFHILNSIFPVENDVSSKNKSFIGPYERIRKYWWKKVEVDFKFSFTYFPNAVCCCILLHCMMQVRFFRQGSSK